MNINLAIEKIREAARAEGSPVSTLGVKAGLGVNTLRDMYKPDWSPDISTLLKLEALLLPAPHARGKP